MKLNKPLQVDFLLLLLSISLARTSFFYLDETTSDSEEETTNSDYASLKDFVLEMQSSEICGEIRGT